MTDRLTLTTLLLAGTAALAAPAFAQPAPDTGITVIIADWLPGWDADHGGRWAIVPAERTPLKWAVESAAATAATPPGTYDFYWIQDEEHADAPMLMAEDVVVAAGALTEVRIQTGTMTEIGDWVPPLDPAVGRLEAVIDDTQTVVNWTATGGGMILPPGAYDLFWDDDVTDDKPSVWMGEYDVAMPFGGLGIEVRTSPDLTVVRTAPGGPGDVAGIMPGDVILAADGTTLVGLELTEAVGHLRGEAGTPVVVSIRRAGTVEPFDITVQRSIVEAQIVVRVDAGIRAVPEPGTTPLGPAGMWFVVYAGEAADQIVTWATTIDEPLLVGHATYDVYWQETPETPARLVAEDVEANTGIIEVTVGPAEPTPPPTK